MESVVWKQMIFDIEIDHVIGGWKWLLKKWYILPHIIWTGCCISTFRMITRKAKRDIRSCICMMGTIFFYNEDATYGKSWGLQEFMRQWENQLIIVGIECNHEATSVWRSFRPMISRILTDKGFMERAKSLCSGWSMSWNRWSIRISEQNQSGNIPVRRQLHGRIDGLLYSCGP